MFFWLFWSRLIGQAALSLLYYWIGLEFPSEMVVGVRWNKDRRKKGKYGKSVEPFYFYLFVWVVANPSFSFSLSFGGLYWNLS